MKHNNKTFSRQHGFTLVELIVAMGVFSIMMLALMTFFNSAQKLWTMSYKKNNSYADARVAMDLMAGMLQTTFYQVGRVPFYIDNTSAQFNKIYFVTNTSFKLAAANYSDIYEVSYQVDTGSNKKNTLNIRYIGDSSASWTFYNSVPPNHITDLRDPLDTASVVPETVINYVTGLAFIPYKKDATSGIAAAGFYDNVPYAISIRMTLLDRESYNKWISMKAGVEAFSGETPTQQEFRQQNEKTFTRMVYLGDRF